MAKAKKKVAKKAPKYVYYFGGKKADGTAEMKNLLGGKGANLAEMVNLKLPVPAGFTITTEVCTYYYGQTVKLILNHLQKKLTKLLQNSKKKWAKKFGDPNDPLLVSVRSGARASMPGMMDTVLNLGLNDTTVKGLIKKIRQRTFCL